MQKINVAIAGAGRFARSMHIPILIKNSKYKIHAVMDILEEAARETCEISGADYWTTDYQKILDDKEIDVVFVITRHDMHASMSVAAANAGKHVFCEKPMGLSVDECRDVVAAVKANNVKYTIGYNRGLAPMISKTKDLLKGYENSKKMIYHRIQAPFPESSWTHQPLVGGGRFVGEGCHIFDLFCELIPYSPVKVYAQGGTFLNPEIVKIPDSAIVTITFSDGSVATTLINSKGCSDFPKEATELYCDGKAVYINDFKHMEYFGFENRKKTIVDFDSTDKGHSIELDLLADSILNDTDSPNGLEQALKSALISYKVNESLRTGMPVEISRAEYGV